MYDTSMDSVEQDFLDLVEFAATKKEFHRGAELMFGPDYKTTGKQVVEEMNPKLMKKFESYFDAN